MFEILLIGVNVLTYIFILWSINKVLNRTRKIKPERESENEELTDKCIQLLYKKRYIARIPRWVAIRLEVYGFDEEFCREDDQFDHWVVQNVPDSKNDERLNVVKAYVNPLTRHLVEVTNDEN